MSRLFENPGLKVVSLLMSLALLAILPAAEVQALYAKAEETNE